MEMFSLFFFFFFCLAPTTFSGWMDIALINDFVGFTGWMLVDFFILLDRTSGIKFARTYQDRKLGCFIRLLRRYLAHTTRQIT